MRVIVTKKEDETGGIGLVVEDNDGIYVINVKRGSDGQPLPENTRGGPLSAVAEFFKAAEKVEKKEEKAGSQNKD